MLLLISLFHHSPFSVVAALVPLAHKMAKRSRQSLDEVPKFEGASSKLVQALGDERHKVPEPLQLFKEGLSGEPPELHDVVVDQPAVEPKGKTPDDMRVRSQEESSDLLVFAERSKRRTTRKPTGRHNVFTHVPADPNCEVCKLTKTSRAPCRNRSEARGDRVKVKALGPSQTA